MTYLSSPSGKKIHTFPMERANKRPRHAKKSSTPKNNKKSASGPAEDDIEANVDASILGLIRAQKESLWQKKSACYYFAQSLVEHSTWKRLHPISCF